MKLGELRALIDEVIATKGFGGADVTVNRGRGGFEDIVDVVYCHECHQYHVISERKV